MTNSNFKRIEIYFKAGSHTRKVKTLPEAEEHYILSLVLFQAPAKSREGARLLEPTISFHVAEFVKAVLCSTLLEL